MTAKPAVLLLSASYQQSDHCARELGLRPGEWKHVSSPADLLGRRGGTMQVVGTPWERNDYYQLLDAATVNGIEVRRDP